MATLRGLPGRNSWKNPLTHGAGGRQNQHHGVDHDRHPDLVLKKGMAEGQNPRDEDQLVGAHDAQRKSLRVLTNSAVGELNAHQSNERSSASDVHRLAVDLSPKRFSRTRSMGHGFATPCWRPASVVERRRRFQASKAE